MKFQELVESKKDDLEILGLHLHGASIVTAPCKRAHEHFRVADLKAVEMLLVMVV
jgi:hypothetical protein